VNEAVLAYDVVENARRTRFFKKLKRHMHPVQRSVFEGRLDARGLALVEKLIYTELDLDVDAVRIWFLSPATANLTRSYGIMPDRHDPDAPIVIG
jgi:CRISPR-associated endonuclease Cas2